MPVDFSNTKALGVLPYVALDAPTKDKLEAEAAALGNRFSLVTSHPADLIADATEMLEAEKDLPDLMGRGYRVSKGLIVRIKTLRDIIAPHLAEQERAAVWSKAQTEAAEKTRTRLLELRAELALVGKAAGLPASLFSLETKKTTRLNVVRMKMDEVLANIAEVRAHMPDNKRVDAMVLEARNLLDQQHDQRAESRVSGTENRARIRERQRYERLLFEAMQVLSAQGLAAYPNDPTREACYRLDHVYGKKPSKVGDPGAGGVDGNPGAAGPGTA